MLSQDQIIWRNGESDLLVEERLKRNEEFHYMEGRSRVAFWESCSRRIYRRYRRRFTAAQCEDRWRNVVKKYGVSKLKINNNNIKHFITNINFLLEFL